MKHIFLGLILGVALATGAHAQLNRVYVPIGSCGPAGSDGGAFVGADAIRVDNTGPDQTYVSYKFPAGVSSVLKCTFYMPPNNAAYTFAPQFQIRGSIPTDGGLIIMGAAAVADIRDDTYHTDSPRVSSGNITTVTSVLTAPGLTKVLTQVAMPVTDSSGLACTALGSACRDMLVTMWIVRLTDNNSCYNGPSPGEPWTCCTGFQTGTCVPGSTYGGDVELLGIFLPY